MDRPVLKLPSKPAEAPNNLRFIERRKRYILQERVGENGEDRWRDVPLVKEA